MPRNGVGLSLMRAAADGDGERHRIAFEPFADLVQGVVELAPTTSILLMNTSRGTCVLVGLPPDRFRLRLDALLGVEDDDAAVEDAQGAFDLGGEIDVAGRVDQVDRCSRATGTECRRCRW